MPTSRIRDKIVSIEQFMDQRLVELLQEEIYKFFDMNQLNVEEELSILGSALISTLLSLENGQEIWDSYKMQGDKSFKIQGSRDGQAEQPEEEGP